MIEMVDLKNQNLNVKGEIDKAIEDVVTSAQYISGPKVEQFENSLGLYLENAFIIGCANGTDALQIALMSLGLRPGDEVIVPAFTYVACAEVVALLQLVPVWVDVDPDTYNISASGVELLITPRTKALIVVHLFGQCADMEPLQNLAELYNFYLIEDTAQSLGAEYIYKDQRTQKAGTIGHIGCTSFFPSKILGGFGDGGALMTRDPVLADRIRMIANHGQRVKYYHETIGVNSRLDSIQAAVLNVKLKYIELYINSRVKAADIYDQTLNGLSWIQTPFRASHSTHVFHQYTIQLNEEVDRDELKRYLSDKGIPSMVYYPLPLHKQKAYLRTDQHYLLPVSEALCRRVLSLPMHTELKSEDIEHISTVIRKFFE